MPERQMQLAKILGSGPGWRRKDAKDGTKSTEHQSSQKNYPPNTYHFIGGSLQAVHQMILVPALPWPVRVQCLVLQQEISI